MAKKGMEPEQVRKMANDIRSAGEDLKSKYDALNSKVSEPAWWEGTDGDKYRGDFADKVGQAVSEIVQMGDEKAQNAEDNASKQEETSSK